VRPSFLLASTDCDAISAAPSSQAEELLIDLGGPEPTRLRLRRGTEDIEQCDVTDLAGDNM
jgi:hypothetical protein